MKESFSLFFVSYALLLLLTFLNAQTCFGKTGIQACSGVGSCVNSVCVCPQGYEGPECQYFSCFGIQANSSYVCSNRQGTCTGYNQCSCSNGYSGLQCETATCFGLLSTDSRACSGRGKCVKNDVCSCPFGYTGSQCETQTCPNGVCSLWSNSSPCPGNSLLLYFPFNNENETMTNLGFTSEFLSGSLAELDNATLTSSPSTCREAATFEQPNAQIVYSENITLSSVFSVEFRFLVKSSLSIQDQVLLWMYQDDPSIVVRSTASNLKVEIVYDGQSKEISFDTNMRDDIMHHLLIRRNGIDFEAVLDGTVSRTTQTPGLGIFTKRRQFANTLIFGADKYDSKYFKGMIDEFKIWSCVGSITVGCLSCPADANNSTCNGRGKCVGQNTCMCNTGFVGNLCQDIACFGTTDKDSASCSGNGKCLTPNKCTCNAGFLGDRCEILTCSGIPSTDSSVCSSRGKCSSVNNCTCNEGYIGSNCESIACNGKNSTDPTVCSGRGTCTAPQTCSCNSNYAGNNCQNPVCFGLSAANPTVCNGKGTCTAPNTCSCATGWSGNQCTTQDAGQVFCFGISSRDTKVCSGRASCIATDVCDCPTSSFTGSACQYPVCNGIASNDIKVCSGAGKCTAPGTCECNAGYSGNNCATYRCGGILSTDSTVCSSKGKCVQPDVCLCNSGYGGSGCSTPICFGNLASNSTVCNGRGSCTGPNTCSCKSGVLGTQCEIPVCFGKSSQDRTVCSGNGNCVDANTCVCKSGYTGPNCDVPICSGINGTDPTVCSGKGSCTAPNTCACTGNYGGSACETCKPDYTGQDCSTKRCDPQTTCNGRGTCSESFDCVCTNTETNKYAGTYCTECARNYYGANCNVFCNPNTTCNAKGTCSSAGTCSCSSDLTTGYWTGAACDSCVEGYYGSDCRTTVGEFAFTSNGDALVGVYTYPSTAAVIDCADILSAASILRLGTGPICIWSPDLNPTNTRYTLRISFGKDPQFVLGDSLAFNVYPRDSTKSKFVVKTPTAPAVSPKPKAVVLGSIVIGQCDSISLDATVSSSPDRRALKYDWTVLSGYKVAELNQHLTTVGRTSSLLTIDASLVEAGFDYQIQLIVENFLGVRSDPTTITVKKLATAVPLARIKGPAVQNIYAANFFRLEAEAILSACFYSNRELNYVWRQTSGSPVNSIQNGKFLAFSPYAFPAVTGSYNFEVRVQPVANPSAEAIATVTINVSPLPLEAAIAGGDRTASRNVDLILDASPSVDPDNVQTASKFEWQCVDSVTGGFCPTGMQTLPSGQVTSVASSNLVEGTYKFILTYIKGDRSASATSTIKVVRGTPPSVKLSAIPRKLNPEDKLFINATIDSPTATLKWSIIQEGVERLVTAADTLTPINSPFIVFKPNAFTAGLTYSIKLEVQAGQEIGSAQATTTINTPPQPGALLVSPTTGTTLETTFTINAVQWVDEDAPLQYTFSYTDPQTQITSVLASKSLSNSLSTNSIPAGTGPNGAITITVTIYDSYGASTTISQGITVNKKVFASTTDLTSYFANQTQSQMSTTSGDPEATSRFASSIASVINPVVRAVTATVCPNDCTDALHGSCNTRTASCTCFNNYGGNDCSLTPAELTARTQIREQLTVNLIASATAASSSQPVTPQFASQQASTIGDISKDPTQLSPNAQKSILGYLASLLTNLKTGGVKIPASAVKSMARAASNLARRQSARRRSAFAVANATETEDQAYYNQLIGSVDDMWRALIGSLAPGEVPQTIVESNFQILAERIQSNSLNSKGIQVPTPTFKTVGSNIFLPYNLTQELVARGRSVNIADINAVTYTVNPYQWHSSSVNISSDVVSLKIMTDEGRTEVPVYGLSSKIDIYIPGTYNPSELETNCQLPGNQPQCRYWNTVTGEWTMDDGCVLVGINNTVAHCQCNHLTDFALFVRFFNPSETLINPVDPRYKYVENQKNFTTTVFAGVGILGYVVSMIVSFIVDRLQRTKTDKEQEQDEQVAEIGLLRQLLQYILTYHVYLSMIIRPVKERNHYTRPQRVTVIWVIIFATCAVNALLLGTYNGFVFILGASFASNWVATIVGSLFQTLFRATKGRDIVPETMKKDVPVEAMVNDAFELEDLGQIALPDIPQDLQEQMEKEMQKPKEMPPQTSNNLIEDKPSVLDKRKSVAAAKNAIKNLVKGKEDPAIKGSTLHAFDNVDFEAEDIQIDPASIPQLVEEQMQQEEEQRAAAEGEKKEGEEGEKEEKKEEEEEEEESEEDEDEDEVQEAPQITAYHDAPPPAAAPSAAPVTETDKRSKIREDRRKSLAAVMHASETQTGEKSQVQRTQLAIAQVLDKGDDALDHKLQSNIGQQELRFLSIGGVVAFVALYFIYAALSVAVLHTSLYFWWPGWLTTLYLTMSPVVLAIIIKSIYFKRKHQIWREEKRWVPSKVFIALSAVLGILCAIGAIVTIIVALATQFWSSSAGIGHVICVLVSLIAMVIICVVSIVLEVKKPAAEKTMAKASERFAPFLPTWSIWVFYPLAWALMLGCAAIEILFGMYMTPTIAGKWVAAWVIALAWDVIIVKTLNVVVQMVFIGSFYTLVDWILAVKVKEPEAAVAKPAEAAPAPSAVATTL